MASYRMHEAAKAHQMADMIESRNETFKQFESLMRDVRDITGDIEAQTKVQGTKLEVID